MKKFTDFYEAWWYLNECKSFQATEKDLRQIGYTGNFLKDVAENTSYFQESLIIEVQKVNPENDTIEEDEKLNTKTVVWLECGSPYYDENTKSILTYHNWDWDCGGDTFEEAIINLANIIWEHENGNK